MKNTVVIIGNYPYTRDLFDMSRTDCDIWSFNESMSFPFYERADAIFQMHSPVIWKNPKNRNDPNHYLWLSNVAGECRACLGKGCPACAGTGTYTPAANRKDITIYMQKAYPEVLNSAEYPIDEIQAKYNTSYFSSSPSYALALAIHLGYKRVELYGIALATDTEYRYQRDGFTFWVGIAKGCGIEVVYHGDIFDAPMYGYEGDVTIDYQVFVDRIAELTPACDGAMARYNQSKDLITQAANAFLTSGGGYQELTAIAQEQIKSAHEFGLADGARQENTRYKNKADAMRNASGGEFIFSRQEFESAGAALYKDRDEWGAKGNLLGPKCEQLLLSAAECKNSVKRKKRFEEFLKAYEQYVQISVRVGMYTGALNENASFLKTLDAHIKAAGGTKSEEAILTALREEINA